MTKIVEFVEIDIDYCSLTYGTAPCVATTTGGSPTGDRKCFNTLGTCQDRANFDNVPVTIRFSTDTGYSDKTIPAIPNVLGISTSPGEISLGRNMGMRSSVNISFRDHKHSDTGEGFDKYLADRSYDPFNQGSFWGKWRARHEFLRGRPLRIIRGELGQSLEQMETRHYVIDSYNGPTARGVYTIVGKDVLKLADNDRAVWPAANSGSLTSAITDTDTTITLTPTGIGDEEYSASGIANIGGKEIASFTRSGDTITLGSRGIENTEAVAHDAGSRFQEAARYIGQDPALIIRNILRDGAGIDSAFMSLATWQAEIAAYLQRNYSTVIAEPTGVNELISSLIEEAGLALWWDDINQQIRLQVLREISTDAATFDNNNILEGSLMIEDQPELRVSQVHTYYARKNPLKSLEDEENFESIRVSINDQNEIDYGSPAIKTIYSRWIPALGGSIADRLNDIILARFGTAPRKFTFDTFKKNSENAILGGGYQIGSHAIQDDQGDLVTVPSQIVSLIDDKAIRRAVAIESRFDGITLDDPNNRVLTIDTDSFNVNIRDLHDTFYPEIVTVGSLTLTVNIVGGVTVGSTSVGAPALEVGTFPVGLPITINNFGRIQGKGGRGGYWTLSGSFTFFDGQDGGTALLTTYPVDVVNDGEIYGGAGGGTAASSTSYVAAGGGGAGSEPGDPAGSPIYNPSAFTVDDNGQGTADAGGQIRVSGGASSNFPVGGIGGGPGLIGLAASEPGETAQGSPGDPGAAIDGISNVTLTGSGIEVGPQIN